jgi:hypothetical protein
MPYVDALRAWGADFSITSTGDLALLQDSPASPAATQQRVIRLIQYVPLILDDAGNPITEPDDIFNTSYGSGARTLIGQNPVNDIISGMKNRILSGLALDPYITTFPTPVISIVAGPTNGIVTVSVSCMTTTGQPVTIPPQQIQLATQ